MDLFPDSKELLELFIANDVKFMVVGGHALGAHGLPRATEDFDLWVWPDPLNAERIISCLAQFGFEHSGLSDKDFTERDTVVQLGFTPTRIDLMTSISGVEFEDAWERRIVATLDGVDFPVIGKADLVANKWALGRPPDLVDLMKLVRQAQRE